MNIINELVILSQHITPESAQKIDYYLHSPDYHVDLVKFYFDDPYTFRTIRNNLLSFIETNAHLYNPQGDGLTDFMINTITTFGLLNNFLVGAEDRQTLSSFISRTSGLWKAIFSDPKNTPDILIVCESILSFFGNVSYIGSLPWNQIIHSSSPYRHVVFGLLIHSHDTLLREVFVRNIQEFFTGYGPYDEYIGGLICSALQKKGGKLFGDFIRMQLGKIPLHQSIPLFDRDLNLGIMIATSPMNVDTKLSYFGESGLQRMDRKSYLDTYVSISLRPSTERSSLISELYAQGVDVTVDEQQVKFADIPFVSYEDAYRYARKNISSLEDLPIKMRTDLFYETIVTENPVLTARREKSVSAFHEIVSTLELEKMNRYFSFIDTMISHVSQEDVKVERYKKVYQSYSQPLRKTASSLSEENVRQLLAFNSDPKIEKYLLDIIARNTSGDGFMQIYIQNLFDEHNFSKNVYLFPYSQIISDLGKGKTDMEVITDILSHPSFYQKDIVKIGEFIEFLLRNQTFYPHKLKIIELFFNHISLRQSQEFSSIVAKNIIVTHIAKNKILLKALDEIESLLLHAARSVPKKSVGQTIKGWFGMRSEYDRLKEAKQYDAAAQSLDQKNEQIISSAREFMNQMSVFIDRYRSYLEELELHAAVTEFEIAKKRIEQLSVGI